MKFQVLLFLVGMMALQQASAGSFFVEDKEGFTTSVNLALRQVGHQLLLAQGDSTSRIPPVHVEGEGGFWLKLESGFDYEQLPSAIRKAFADYEIDAPYEIAVKSCQDNVLLLGFNRLALERDTVPCEGRAWGMECAIIFVYFDQSEAWTLPAFSLMAWIWLPLLVGFGYFLFRYLKKHESPPVKSSAIQLGQYRFDPQNQELRKGEDCTTLTFRENKLLQYFAERPNTVLARADILAAVWEEEGVMVGRSLDVFVSRLRKLLKEDQDVQINSVHGVGYRLDIA